MRITSILVLAVAIVGLFFNLAAWPQRSGGADPPAQPVGMSLRLELFVSDLEKSAEFYTKVLGFERQPGEDDYLPVRCGSVVIGFGPAAGLPKRHYFNPELQTARLGDRDRIGS